MKSRTSARSTGQSLVEFALILSVLLMVFLGLFDLGRAFQTFVVITNAAREGARYGSMHPGDVSGIVDRVQREADSSGVTIAAGSIQVSSSWSSGSPVTVQVDHPFSLMTAWLVGRRTLTLHGRAEMVVL